jgi:hypothetical protein
MHLSTEHSLAAAPHLPECVSPSALKAIYLPTNAVGRYVEIRNNAAHLISLLNGMFTITPIPSTGLVVLSNEREQASRRHLSLTLTDSRARRYFFYGPLLLLRSSSHGLSSLDPTHKRRWLSILLENGRSVTGL